MSLAQLIVDYMAYKNYFVDRSPLHFNIIYIEGMNRDGSLNNDAPNIFNDLRLVIEFIGGRPSIIDSWEATTEPGFFYTKNPMNPKGAARIGFGQYQAWMVGTHGRSEPHEALIQVYPVRVHRDLNKDMVRTGDRIDIGLFGINQHHGYDLPVFDINKASAGCLVGRSRAGHREFMGIIKSDRRYRNDKDYIFRTTIIPGDDLLKYARA